MNKLLNDIQDTPGEVNPRIGKFFLHLNKMVKVAREAELSEKINLRRLLKRKDQTHFFLHWVGKPA